MCFISVLQVTKNLQLHGYSTMSVCPSVSYISGEMLFSRLLCLTKIKFESSDMSVIHTNYRNVYFIQHKPRPWHYMQRICSAREGYGFDAVTPIFFTNRKSYFISKLVTFKIFYKYNLSLPLFSGICPMLYLFYLSFLSQCLSLQQLFLAKVLNFLIIKVVCVEFEIKYNTILMDMPLRITAYYAK